MPDHDRRADIRKVAKILRDGNYSYDQSADLFKKTRREVGLSPPNVEFENVLGKEVSAAAPGGEEFHAMAENATE